MRIHTHILLLMSVARRTMNTARDHQSAMAQEISSTAATLVLAASTRFRSQGRLQLVVQNWCVGAYATPLPI